MFTYGPDDKNLMIYGNVGVELPEGTKHSKEWAGRYEIVDTGSGGLKFKYVQVFVVSSFPTLGPKKLTRFQIDCSTRCLEGLNISSGTLACISHLPYRGDTRDDGFMSM